MEKAFRHLDGPSSAAGKMFRAKIKPQWNTRRLGRFPDSRKIFHPRLRKHARLSPGSNEGTIINARTDRRFGQTTIGSSAYS